MAKSLVLTGISGNKVGITHSFSGRSSVIGSAPGCTLVLQDRLVLPRHAEIRQMLERWFVVPLDSTAHIFIDGLPVRVQSRLMEGSTLTLGTATFKIAHSEIAEQMVNQAPSSNTGVPRLGEYLIKRGTLSRAQVQHAVQRQGELQQQGRRLQLGDVIVELGYASRYQLEQAVQDQRSDFFERFRD